MSSEFFIEEGTVISSSDGYAQISLTKNDQCSECSARIICKAKDDENRILKVNDPYGTQPGDVVKIEIQGSAVMKISFILYGLPLLLLLTPVLFVNVLFKNIANPELLSFACGIFLVGIYYLVLFMFRNRSKKPQLPQIISFRRKKD